MWRFAEEMRQRVDAAGDGLREDGERLLDWMQRLYDERDLPRGAAESFGRAPVPPSQSARPPAGAPALFDDASAIDWLGLGGRPLPYEEFRRRMAGA
jgi:hypothetical protein